MMKNIKHLILALFLLLVPVAASTATPAYAQHNPLQGACTGKAAASPACQQANAQGTNDPVTGTKGVLYTAINILAIVAGVGAVIMILLGAFFVVSSGGSAETAKKGKDRIAAALIGLIIIAVSWTVVRFLIDKLVQ